MEFRDKIWLGVCIMLALGGTLFAIIAWNSWRSTYRIIRNGIQTEGMVLENRRRPARGLEARPTSVAPVVQFVTPDGRRCNTIRRRTLPPPLFRWGKG